MKNILLAMALVWFVGCGGGSGSDTEDEKSKNIAPIQGVITPYGSGTVGDKYVINQRGLYGTNESETYYVTSPIEKDCVIIIDPSGYDIWNVELYNSGTYTNIPLLFKQGKYITTVPSTARYGIEIRTYQKSTFNLDVSCWNEE